MTLKEYLQSRLCPSSIPTHLTTISHLKAFLGEAKTEQAGYSDILEYIGLLRGVYKNISTIQRKLQSIKQYYRYLVHTGRRKDHPCRYFLLQDAPRWNVQLQDLYSEKELEKLLTEPVHPKGIALRNQVIIGLLIYQALTRRELLNLKIKDIHLEEATILVGAATTHERTLQLKPRQIMLLHRYLNEERAKLLTRGNPQAVDTADARLILSFCGQPDQDILLNYLIKQLRKIFPGRKLTAYTIRQSAIANLLKQGKDLRIVQTFAGHKYPDSTEKYRQTGIEALKTAIQKHHPIQ